MSTWLDDLLGKTIAQNNVALPDRKRMNFRAGSDLSVEDNPTLGTTDVFVEGASAVKTYGEVIAAVSTTGDDTSTVRPTILSSGDYSAYPFLTIKAALDSLPVVLRDKVTVTVEAGAYDGVTLSGFAGGGPLRLCGEYTLQTISSGAASGTAGSGTSTTALKKPSAAGNWPTDGSMRGLLVVIDSGPGSNGDSAAPVVRPIKDNTTDTLTIEAISSLASGAVFRVCLAGVTLTNIPSPPAEVTHACLAVLDSQAQIELHGIKPHDAGTMQYGIYVRNADVEAHGLDLSGSVAAMFYALDSARAALYDSRLKSSANFWSQRCRDSVAERIYQDNGAILMEDSGFGSVKVESRNCAANAVKFHGGSRYQAKINANDFTVAPLVLDSIGRFDTLGLTGSSAAATYTVVASGGGIIDLSGMTMAGSVLPELSIDGKTNPFADAINFSRVTGGMSSIIPGGTGLVKDISDGFALNTIINGGNDQEYGPQLLLGGPPPTVGSGYVATAFAGGGQASAVKMAFRYTLVTAANDHDSMKLLGTPDIFNTVIYQTAGVNIGTKIVDLYPPSGKHIFLAGADQGADTKVDWSPGQQMIGVQNPNDGSWWINLV